MIFLFFFFSDFSESLHPGFVLWGGGRYRFFLLQIKLR